MEYATAIACIELCDLCILNFTVKENLIMKIFSHNTVYLWLKLTLSTCPILVFFRPTVFDFSSLKVIYHQICRFAKFVFFQEFILRLRKSPNILPYGGKTTELLRFKVRDFQSAKNILTVP